MSNEEEYLSSLKSVIRTAFKYGVYSGIQYNLQDLIKVKKSFLGKSQVAEAEEIDFIIEFLKKEEDSLKERYEKHRSKTLELAEQIPIGMLLSFRYFDETYTGELRGFLADKVLIIAKHRGRNKLFEVNPYDVKV